MQSFYSCLGKPYLRFLLLCLSLQFLSLTATSQNLGFEAAASTPPNNWSAVTGTWVTNTSVVRTGLQSMAITDPATSGTTGGTTNPFVTTTAAGNYLITIGWGRASTPSNGLFYLGYRSGTANTLNPTSTATGQAANLNDVSWTRITSVSASTLAAGSYGYSLRAFRSAASPSTTIYIDDVIMYASTSNIPDLSAPGAATNFVVAGNNLSWTNGTDNGSPASGIGGVVIVRAAGSSLPAPTLNDQATYNVVNGAAGVGSFVQNGTTWTVVGTIDDNVTTSFTDASATGGPYTYALFMRDRAYNYSTGVTTGATVPCTTPPNAGSATVTPSASQCPGTSRSLGLTGNSFGTGQTYAWESASAVGGPFSPVSTSSSAPNFSVSPTVTTYYRAAVTCGGNTQYSVPVQVLVTQPLSGTYTINGAQSTGGTNFQTFAAAVGALNCGISGPVTFNVSNATYNEQVVLPVVSGTSATNTITFNGNGATISFNSTTTGERGGITLDGTDYVRIRNFTIDGSAGTYGWGILLTNGADNNIIENNTINVSTTNITSANHAGIVLSGSFTSAVTAGNNANNTLIQNNTITGGYYSIVVYGNSTAGAPNTGNQVKNNTLREAYSYHIYSAYQSGVVISGNDVSRPTRTGSAATAGVFLTTGNVGALVEKNRIHNLFDAMTTNTSTTYGIYVAADGVAGQENKLVNNLVYAINSNGTVYGIYNTTGAFMQAYHNTIVLDFAGTTTGTTYGIYQTGSTTGIDLRNNIVYITRGGTGIKRALYFVTTTSSIVSNNNVLYLGSTTGTDNFLGQFGTATFATLQNWQTANSNAYDQQSLGVDPQFTSITLANFLPTNGLVASAGTGVGVTTDIVNIARNPATPTPGAYEIPPSAGTDLGALALFAPVTKNCYSNAETVTIIVRNNSAATHNFVAKPLTLQASVTGPNPQVFAPVTVNTGTLAPGDSLNVVVSTNYNMSAAGSYVFAASTSVSGDVNTANDAMPATTRVVTALARGTVSASQTSYCVTAGTPTLTLSGSAGGNIQWQEATAPGGPWTNVGTSQPTYTPATAITSTRYYRALVSCNANSAFSDTATVTYSNPLVTATAPAGRCGTGTVTLGATASAGATLNWYAASSGGTALATGSSFTTPVLSSTTTYYVSASAGGSFETVGKASPTTTTNTTGNSWGLVFNVVNTAITLQSVDIYSVGTAAGSISVSLTDNAGVVLATAGPFSYPAGSTATPVAVTLPLNFNVPVGTGYRLLSAANSGGALIRETSGSTFPYNSNSGNVSITSGYISGTSTTYYWFYNWQVSTGCESPRQAVTATVGASAPLSITGNTTVCNNAVLPLSVTSTLSNYDVYSWTPVTGLYTDAAATIPYTGGNASTVYAKSGTAGLQTYYVSANNTLSSCSGIDSVKVTVLPASLAISASQPNLCVSGSVTLSLPSASYGAATFQWASSTDGTNFTPITGATATSYTTPTLTSTTYYRVTVSNSSGAACLQPAFTVTVNNPQLTGTTPGSRCGPGTVILSATGSAGTSLNWYTAATGGTLLGTGANFTTPILNNTTTYYVGATVGSSVQSVGATTVNQFPNGGTNASFTAGMLFDVLAGGTTIQSVDIFPTTAVGTNFQIVIRSGSATGTVVATYQGTTTVSGTTAAPVAQTVPVNFTLPAGTYAMTFFNGTLQPPLSGTAVYPGALRNNPSTGATFPYTLPGVLSITNGSLSNVWYYFYNWKIGTGCESPRQAVTATVNAGPAFDVTDNLTICNGSVQQLSVTTPIANFTSYQWVPATNLYTDAAATVPYTGGSATTLYVKNTTAGTYTYVVNALNGSTNCSGIDSVKVTVLPGNITINAIPTQICVSGSVALSISPATGYTGASFQWQQLIGATWTDIASATASTYTTPTITATTQYRVLVKNSAGVVCQQPSVTITVNSPSIVSSQGAVNCGAGSLSLTAAGSAGTVLNWYTSAAGGAPVGTGSPFNTGNITTTTTYYVSATSGGTIQALGPVSPDATTVSGKATSASTTTGMLFDVLNPTQNVNIQSVDIFPTSPVGTAFTIVVRQGPGTAGAILASYSGVTTVQGTAAAPLAQTVPVNFSLPGGFDYVMLFSGTAPTAIRNTATTALPAAITGQLSVTNGTTSGSWNYFYNWRIGNGCESPRVAVVATISTNTAITNQPVAQSICSGATLSLGVDAVGAGLTYQWFKGATAITGATSATLTIPNAQVSDAGQYSVRITGACGTVTSQTVTVNVNGTNSWLGVVSTDWHNPANWCGGVPTATSDVVIPVTAPNMPVVNALADVRNLTINSGASVTVLPNGFLNFYGNLQNNGSFNATTGFVGFKGTTAKTANDFTVGTLVINGTGGVAITSAANVTTLILENGNISLGASDLTIGGPANGSVQSHIVTNGTGLVLAQNVTANFNVPVGPDATSYNPVTINNGQGRSFRVQVQTGINPAITNVARAINRTWTVTPSTAVTSPVELTFQWADTHGNASVVAGGDMEVAVNTGASGAVYQLLTPAGGLTPMGNATQRRVTIQTTAFGNFVVSSPGGFTYPLSTPGVDPDVTGVQLLPNIVEGATTLRVQLARATRLSWVITDGSGKSVLRFEQSYGQGRTDKPLNLMSLASGSYYLVGFSSKGRVATVKFIKH